ncbi:MAG TPA: bifunctional 5,10-methylenetetrahydrofolate dehydrogenase/5,10-methenyltetrahydrofolate cyclohydrolase [Vicinamibacterales bacterium]|nr:bifunctional 5,10-methylenetetrahydrofolate dehydrogenase/5,10-methenyltetrahydrofolate cyclohydrolase [Vicinamibacterales bacterium]
MDQLDAAGRLARRGGRHLLLLRPAPFEARGGALTARRLDGAALAATLRAEVQPLVAAFTAARGRAPALHIVLAGQDPASDIYVRNKQRAGDQAGLTVEVHRLGATTSAPTLLALIARLNADDTVDGILVQSPLPPAMGEGAERQVFDAIDPAKDVDGFHPVNVGRLVQGRASLAPCTPSGVIELLEREGIPIKGRRAVVIGRSDIVGKPMALLLLHRDATVTICHSRTVDVARVAAEADILVAAVGRAGLVTPAFVKPGATVVDIGINRVTDRARAVALFGEGHPRLADFDARGSVVVGDVHPDVDAVAGALTPVPGGVGPLTIALLLRNTLTAARQRSGAL